MDHIGEILSLVVAFSWTATVARLKLKIPFIGVSLSLMALTPVLIIIPYSLIYKQRINLQEVLGTLVTVSGVAMFFLF